ncbi:TPM domain-containing protein [Hymenobacter persicinus]|uniref:TPM domain-containing protein n=1 Tax=Hymenobacter persicinus TaxID=2025506 RepID=A0A4Q5LET5_9BACT|nr:TPM domain-containing protein [Hymenobacter persicinus]RYU80994.1 TPM domain-containing protein [Hymenobacter persicinus]
MHRFLFFALLWLTAGLGLAAPVAPADELPARPVPFRFVTDQGQLLSAAEAQSLENGLRRFADANGTQVVVVTVPTLGGRAVADYARALGESWGVGQRGKDNGVVLLVAAQEHQVSIQTGKGLRDVITPALTSTVINEQLTPLFKQGRYFAGLRAGLNKLLSATDPGRQNTTTADAGPAGVAAGAPDVGAAAVEAPGPEATAAAPATTDSYAPPAESAPASEPFRPSASVPEPESSGPGGGMLAVGALLLGGVLWLVSRLFRRRAAAPAPDFLPNQPAAPNQPNRPGPGTGYNQRPGQPAPDFLPNRGTSGSGMGGMLMTGAAAAAGAYLGNRMAHGQDESGAGLHNQQLDDAGQSPLAGPAAGAASGAASGGFPALNDDAGSAPEQDYFSDDAGSAEPDYFSSDDTSSYDDSSSGDTGGGGFDDDSNNSGSW